MATAAYLERWQAALSSSYHGASPDLRQAREDAHV